MDHTNTVQQEVKGDVVGKFLALANSDFTYMRFMHGYQA